MKKYIFGHTEQNPLIVNDYPYGFRLRTQIKYWLETDPKKGDRFCSQTLNPKNNRWNNPKKSTYSTIGVMFLDENNHTHWDGISQYTSRDKAQAFIDSIGGQDKLNPLQLSMFKQMMGFVEKKVDEFSGKVKKNFSVQWGKNHSKTAVTEVKITFDRPDGVKIREIFEAMKTLDQKKLLEMLNGWESQNYGLVEGFARICVRGGVQLTTVSKEAYLEYLASDENVINEG